MLALGDCSKHGAGVVREVLWVLFVVQQATIALVQPLWQIPVEERDHGLDAGGEQVVDELDVEVETGLVDWVVAAAKRDHTRPRDGEAVGLRAGLLEKVDILGRAVVGVAGHVAGAAAGDLAGDLAEGVPDGGAAAIGLRGALNLVAKERGSAVDGGERKGERVGGREGGDVRCGGKAPEEVLVQDGLRWVWGHHCEVCGGVFVV